ncbi:MAG: DUF4838 domain-containing protein [Armatimonadota bacterium]
MMTLRRLLTIAAAVSLVAVAAADSVTLVSGGRANFTVALPAEPDAMEQKAAAEFEAYMAKLAGVGSELQRSEAPAVTVEIGSAAANDVLRERAAADQSGYFVEVTADTIRLAGTTPRATCYAVYDLLERLGCRWFMPGEIGEVVPRLGQVNMETFSAVELPDFTARRLQSLPQGEAIDEWELRNRLGGPHLPASHAWNSLVPPEQYYQAHPEYYSLVDGERVPSQLCTSNPAVVALAAENIIRMHEENPDRTWFGIGPNDGGGFCECPKCRAQDTGDYDPFSGEISITDRFLRFANAVAEQVHQLYPDIKFAFYAYSNYMRPPTEVVPDPSIVPAIAPITLCRLHGMGNPVCPERNYHQYLIREWTRISPEVYHRGYSYNLAGPNLPLNYVSRWAYEIPYCKRAGITGFRVETQMSWANYGPLGYVMARLMWNADLDVQALLEDYYEKFYGPAAVPMQQYWTRIDRARRDAPYHTGNAVNIPDIYAPEVMKYLFRRLEQAKRMAKTDAPYEARVQIAEQSFAYLDAFLRMRQAAEEFRWREAKQALDEMRQIGEWMHQHDPPLMERHGGVSRVDRFWANEVEQALERVEGRNELVHRFDDQWRAYMDPLNVGEDLRYWARRLDDDAWQRLRTFSASWSDQGLRYYRGAMWYRQRVTVPPKWGGRKLVLWFGGVDETAKLWVNETYIGEWETNGWQPIETDITHAVRFGRENLICVKVTNEELNEIGTGGITRPVMIWSPAPAGETEPEQGEPEAEQGGGA